MEEDHLNNLAKGTFIILLGVFLSKFLTLIYRMIIARFGTYDYGLLVIGLGIFGFVSIIATLGLDMGVAHYVAYYNAKNEARSVKNVMFSSLKISFITSLLSAILLFIFSDKISILFFHDQNLSIIIKAMAFAIPCDVLRRIFFSGSKAFNKAQHEVYAKYFLENLTKILFTLLFFVMGLGLFGLGLAYTLSVFCSLVLGFYLFNKLVKIFDGEKFEQSSSKMLISYSWPLLFASLFFTLLLWTDTFMIGYFMNPSSTGIYNAATPLAQVMLIFPFALLGLFLPIMTTLYAKGDKNLLSQIHTISLKWNLIFGLMILSSFILFPKQLLNLFFGSEYTLAWVSLLLLGIGCLISSYIAIFQRLCMAIKKTKVIFLISILGLLMNVILNVLLIKKCGINGAAIASLISTFFMVILNFTIIKEYIQIKNFISFHLKIGLVFIISLTITYLFNKLSNHSYFFIISLGFFVVFFFATLLITRSFTKGDLILFISLKKKYAINLPILEKFIKKFI